MDKNKLNPIAKKFANYLFTILPQLAKCGRINDDEEYEGNRDDFVIETRSPANNQLLFIVAGNGEITVGFGDYFHTHFELTIYDTLFENDKDDISSDMQKAAKFIENIINENVKLALCERNGKYVGSICCDAKKEVDANSFAKNPDKLIVYSWNGKYDKVVDLGNT
ncbi:MAG: hypothetical protein PHQ96_05865 [Candidatus Omnitrophica bacterium]|nr:hypothetical protein [Candidatus Omnitrophota bacterium]